MADPSAEFTLIIEYLQHYTLRSKTVSFVLILLIWHIICPYKKNLFNYQAKKKYSIQLYFDFCNLNW